jgi:uncharacterized protein
MYLVGGPHPRKAESQILVERAIAASERLVTDAEVLQEILHRYVAIQRKDAMGSALAVLLDLVDIVYPVDKIDVLRASEILKQSERLSARDALHIAVMERHSVRRLLSFDSDFDQWPGIERLHRV